MTYRLYVHMASFYNFRWTDLNMTLIRPVHIRPDRFNPFSSKWPKGGGDEKRKTNVLSFIYSLLNNKKVIRKHSAGVIIHYIKIIEFTKSHFHSKMYPREVVVSDIAIPARPLCYPWEVDVVETLLFPKMYCISLFLNKKDQLAM